MEIRKPTIFTYVLRHDYGAAPNPFWGVCTLVICKPVIRRGAKVGDWIIGTGSANSPIGDIRNSIVYIMNVTTIMSMFDYDSYTNNYLQQKIPDWFSGVPRLMVGDSVYDFTTDPPRQRKSVHNAIHRKRDLKGNNALLSNHFLYFGDNPITVPIELQGMIMRNQGHRSESNSKYIRPFLSWLKAQDLKINHLYGKPQGKLFQDLEIDLECKSDYDS